jgi:hypothetical protein
MRMKCSPRSLPSWIRLARTAATARTPRARTPRLSTPTIRTTARTTSGCGTVSTTPAYRSEIPRFCSEFGFQAPPVWRTLIDWVHAVDGGPLDAADDAKNDVNFLLHQKADDGNGKLDRGLTPHLGVPDNFADWHWATQLNQARAEKRHPMPRSMTLWSRCRLGRVQLSGFGPTHAILSRP